mgnify:CR=1 FL=1
MGLNFKKTQKQKREFGINLKECFLLAVFLYLILFSTAYFLKVPVVKSAVDYVIMGGNLNRIVYKTYLIELAGEIPETVKTELTNKLKDIENNGTKRFVFDSNELTKSGRTNSRNLVKIEVKTKGYTGKNVLSSSYIVPVGHSYWIKDGIKTDDIKNSSLVVSSGEKLLVEKILKEKYGEGLKISESKDLKKKLKSTEGEIGFIDFNSLDSEFKLLELDGKYILEEFRESGNKEIVGGIPYIISVGDKSTDSIAINVIKFRSNELFKRTDFTKISKINMTGVTAISRSLAIKIEATKRYDYPAERIFEFLRDADLTHTSNEVSFVKGCVPSSGMRFCSNPNYIKTLEKIGVDVIELTGNHNNDFGSSNNASTINMYKDKGWDYFGGGLNADDAKKILYKEVNGTKIAFLGYNWYDTIYRTGAIASRSAAGANSFSDAKIKSDIEKAKKEGAIVIVDFQFQECYSYPENGGIYPICYKPLANPDQKGVFRKAVDYGADIVIGTQAHQPQTYEIYKNKSIYYGLGNLFFDQIQWIGTRQGLVLSHYFINGKHVQTKLTTTIYDSDMRPYVTTGSKRTELLKLLKEAR